MSARECLSDRALNRALLARQGLLARFDGSLVEAVETIGAMQGQAWAALPVGLWSRMSAFEPGDLYAALEREELLWGIGIRGTLHLVSARQHPAYAAVAAVAPTGSWHRAIAQTTPAMGEMRDALLQFAGDRPRTNEEIGEFAETWVGEHPNAIDPRELEAQRSLKWRPIYRWSALRRVPGDAGWGAKAPGEHLTVPIPPGSRRAPSLEDALAQLTRFHLRAFGPAAAEDVAGWIGWRTPPIQELLEGLEELVSFKDDRGRTLYDLPEAPRPYPDTPAPPRLLGAFDSTLLAYAAKRRERILPESLRDVVYQKANLQIRPTLLLDGLVAGTWSIDVRRGEATLTLRPAGKLTRADRTALSVEGTGLLEALHPSAKAHRVTTE
jgi:winged helix DNA-binding protein